MIFQTVWTLVLLECTPTIKNVTCSVPSVHDLELQLNTELEHINLWLKANKLSLNVAKTKFVIISSRQKLQTLMTTQ